MKSTKRISFLVMIALVLSLFSITSFAATAKTATIKLNGNEVSITNVKEEGKVDYSNSMGGIGIITLYKVEAGSKMTLKAAATVEVASAAYHTDNADKTYKGINEVSNQPINSWDGKGSYAFENGLYIVYFDEDIIAVEMGAAAATTTPAATTTTPAVTTTPAATTTTPAATTTTPAATTTPAVTAPQTATAAPTVSKVLVNGAATSFDAYNINGNNYFKLRDIANTVNTSKKQFEVSFDAAKNAINLKSDSAYTKVGGEMAKSDGKAKTATLSTSKIYKDGTELTLTAYNIGGNNYFKLRDVAQAFNIGVTFDSKTNTINIDTNADYVAQ